MKDSGSMHKKVQEMCDCYATTDPLKEMSTLKADSDTGRVAVKWLALVALHGVNNNAREISIHLEEGGKTTVLAEYKVTELPSPGDDVGQKFSLCPSKLFVLNLQFYLVDVNRDSELIPRRLSELTPALQKPEGSQSQGAKGAAVARYCNPLATMDLASHRLSR